MLRDRMPLPVRMGARFSSRTLSSYAACKLWTDPVYAAVAERLLPTGLPLTDIGCGIGLCAFYLREQGYEGPVLGVDPDGPKIAAAQAVAAAHDARSVFREQDGADPAVFSHPSGRRGHVVMLDVLHYFEPGMQRTMLERMAGAVAPGGWAILRATPRDASWRYRCTRAEEWFTQKIGWMRSPPQHFPTVEQVAAPFEAAGFASEVRPLWGRTPFNSYLFAFHRPG